MREYAEDIKDEIEKVAGVREVSISGGEEREFEIAYDPQKLLYYKISSDEANSAVAAANVGFPAGNFDGENFVYPIRTDSKVYTEEEIANIPVSASSNGSSIKSLG
jgi:multidrug efflux pump subunit AcrB